MKSNLGQARISMSKIETKCADVSSLLKSLAHQQRLLILGHLTQGQKTVTELQELCHISQSQLSQFLARMRLEGLVECERQGRYQFYSIADKNVTKLIESIQTIFCR